MKEQIKKLFSNLQPRDMIYPGISLVLLIALVVIFFMASKSLYAHIDSAISLETGEESSLLRLDMENLTVLANKLAIPIQSAETFTPPEIKITPTETGISPTEDTSPTLIPTETNRASVRIAVYNSTETAGLAGKLKSALESEKFVVVETGNKTPTLETTVIQTKASLDASLRSAINAAVSKSYTVTAETLPSDSAFDVIIIIGTK